ncbi:MAG: 4Fe-4S dicluster domain-containing protein, partial [Chloroflexi bacterium]
MGAALVYVGKRERRNGFLSRPGIPDPWRAVIHCRTASDCNAESGLALSLLDAAERFASIDRSQIILDTKRCLHSQDQYSDCAACFSICPVRAITVGKPPVLHSERCQTCRACLPACPVGAYRADDDVADLLNCATHVEDQTVELVCGLHPQPETGADSESIGIRIGGCLAGLGTGAYLTLTTLGRTHIISRTDACRACKWQTLGREVHHQTERANRFLSAYDGNHTVSCMDEVELPVERVLWDAKNPPLSRRDLFRMMARQGQVAMARAMENGVTASKRQPGRDRLRLLSAMSHSPEPATNADTDGFGFATLTISESCTACGTCGRACPTEALRFEKNDEEMTFAISFSAQNCIGCDLCEHVCLPNAITLDHAPTFEQVFGAKEPLLAASG